MTTIGKRPPPKVYVGGNFVDVSEGICHEMHRIDSLIGRALLELIERRAADVVGVAVDPAESAPVETPLRALAGYVNDARADIADAVGVCGTNEAAEALTTALTHMNAVVRLCVLAAVRDAS